MFGDKNIARVAARNLEAVTMKDSHHAQRYIIDFAQWAPLTGYNDVALANQFYKGLPDRLKDRICEHGRPSEFVELRSLALCPRRTTLGTSFRDVRLQKRVHFQSSPVASTPRINTAASSSSTTFKPSTNPNTKPDRPKIPGNQVTSSGHLTEEEKQRRRDRNLCMYCGSNEHLRPACPLTGPPRESNKPRPPPTTSTSTSKPATTTTGSSSGSTRVGRIVLTVPADPPASIETIEETPDDSNPEQQGN